MKSTIENIDPTHIRLDITILKDDWQRASNRIYGTYAGELQIPGFRRGRAPRSVIDKHVGPKQMFDAIREEVVNNTVLAAIQEYELKPLATPDLDTSSLDAIDSIPKNEEIGYSATLEIWPEVSDFTYKSMKILTTKRDVTDEHLDNGIMSVQKRFAKNSDVTDRGIEKGDLVTFRFKGTAELPPPDDAESSDAAPEPFVMDDEYTISVGDDESIPGIADVLAGLKPGDETDFEITLPEGFPKEELRGKPMKSHANIIKIEQVDLPELTDEFIEEKLKFKDMAELRTNLKESMERQNLELKKKEAVEALEEYFVRVTDFTPPDSLLESRREMILDNMQGYYRRMGQDLDEMMRDKEKAAEINQRVDEEAHSQVRLEMVYDEIARKESIKVEPDEVQNYIYMMQQYSQLKNKDIKRLLKDQNFILSIRNDIKNKKVIDFLYENNKIEEVPDPSECERRVESPEDHTAPEPEEPAAPEPEEPAALEPEEESGSVTTEDETLDDNNSISEKGE